MKLQLTPPLNLTHLNLILPMITTKIMAPTTPISHIIDKYQIRPLLHQHREKT